MNSAIESLLQGESKLNVKQFSLLFGFEFTDIHIAPVKNERHLFKAKRIAFKYNIPFLFLGRVKLSELAIVEPDVFLHKKDKEWNFEKLLIPSDSKKDSSKIKDELTDDETAKDLEEIKVYLPISLFALAVIEDLQVEALIEEGDSKIQAKITNFDFKFLLDTHRFRSIPLNPQALEIIDELTIHLNPNKPIGLFFKDGNAQVDTKIDFKLTIDHIKNKKSKILTTHIDIGSNEIPLTWKDRKIKDISFRVLSDLNINFQEDEINWERFRILFQNREWIDLNSHISAVTTNNPVIDLKFKETEINLKEISSVSRSFPFLKKYSFDGSLFIRNFKSTGNLNDLKTDIFLEAKNVTFILPQGKHSIPVFQLDINTNLDLKTDKKPGNENVLPILKEVKVNKIYAIYNGIKLNLTSHIIPDSKMDLNLDISNIRLQNFTKEAQGITGLKIQAKGNSLSNFGVNLDLWINQLRYSLGKNLSAKQSLKLEINKNINLDSDLQLKLIRIPNIVLKMKNSNGDQFTSIQTGISAVLGKEISLEVNKLKLDVNFTKMIPSLPINLKNTIMNIRSSLGNNIKILGKINYSKNQSGDQDIQLDLKGNLPALKLEDLGIGVDISLLSNREKTIRINSFHLDAFQNKLRADYKGTFYKPEKERPAFGELAGKLMGKLRMKSTNSEQVINGVFFNGILDFNLDINNNIVMGNLHTEKSNIRIENDHCPGIDCQYFNIEGLVIDIPFKHDLFQTNTLSLTSGNKDTLIQNYGTKEAINFKIERIKATHPTIPNQSIEYIYPGNNSSGASASIVYKENIFRINDLNINTLGGNISGKNILFNVGSGNPKDMELSAFFRIRDIDLKKLLPEKSQSKIDDGKIKADLNLTLKDLSDPVGNMNLFFSVHQIGKDFGTSAINIVSPTNLITDAIIRSYSVNRVEVELNKGLVYAEILFNRSLMNRTFFRIENDRLKEERIPISKFLNQAKGELSNYK
ncbi:MAG: hypothetical protein JJT78_12300 [Leptospira sp.]|nr:hypothetical protein [Leptospira sp.]